MNFVIGKIIFIAIIWMIYSFINNQIINGNMKKLGYLCCKIKFKFKSVFRLLKINKASHYVWIELIKYHKNAGWNFGQFEKDKLIRCSFMVDDTNAVNFKYIVEPSDLIFSSIILPSFDEEITNDILVLASHFNGLLNFGVVKVSVKYNYVEFVYSGDVISYSLFPGKISSDTDTHFRLTQDCFWSFSNMIETGEDPVFVFSEFLKRKEEGRKE